MDEEKKPSSIRMRVAAVRRTFARKVSVIKLVIGTLLLGLAATGLVLAF